MASAADSSVCGIVSLISEDHTSVIQPKRTRLITWPRKRGPCHAVPPGATNRTDTEAASSKPAPYGRGSDCEPSSPPYGHDPAVNGYGNPVKPATAAEISMKLATPLGTSGTRSVRAIDGAAATFWNLLTIAPMSAKLG